MFYFASVDSIVTFWFRIDDLLQMWPRIKLAVILGVTTAFLWWLMKSHIEGNPDSELDTVDTATFSQGRSRPVQSPITGRPVLAPITGRPVKRVLIFGDKEGTEEWLEFQDILSVFRKNSQGLWVGHFDCPIHGTTIELTLTSDVEHFEGQDAIIFGVLPKMFKSHGASLIKIQPKKNQTWI